MLFSRYSQRVKSLKPVSSVEAIKCAADIDDLLRHGSLIFESSCYVGRRI